MNRQPTARLRLPPAPGAFEGSVGSLIRDVIEPILPPVEAVARFHDALFAHVHGLDPLFLVELPGRSCGTGGRTAGGDEVRLIDEAAALQLHVQLFADQCPEGPFRDWLHALPRAGGPLPRLHARAAGWRRALLLPLDQETTWQAWSRRALTRRMVRALHPCNQLLLPAAAVARISQDPDVRSALAYAGRERYRGVWAEFLSLAGDRGPVPRAAATAVRVRFPDRALPPEHVAVATPAHGDVVVGVHLVCPSDRNVIDLGDGTFETGVWSIPADHLHTLREVYLHHNKGARSHRQGRLVSARRVGEGSDAGVILRVQQRGEPRVWSGGGAGEVGLVWAALRGQELSA